jgi:methanogenic corrinoid protein MtbC1
VDLLLQTGGFKVYDLGVDVPPERFVAKVLELRPDIVGLSGLLTQAYDSMKETISLLRIATSDWPKPLPIIIGGNQLDEQVRVYVGADYWTSEALDGVRICQRLMKER